MRYAKATVNGVAGVILLPDDWSTSYYALASTNTSTAAFSANNINSTNWTNSLEAHGAVFLPAGGNRSFGNIYNQNTYGFYWSNSPDSEDGNKASLMMINGGEVQTQYTENRGYGFSVRLVKNVRIDVTGVTLSPAEAFLTVGGTTTLPPTFTPSNATNKSVTWSSSNTSVATVSNGVVTAVGAGTAIITVTSTNGTVDTSDDKTATCAVTVSPSGYSVALKANTEDEGNWTGKAGTGTYQSLPLTGVAAGTQVTATYSGAKKVKSVKAKKKQ